jgi:pectate lyase
MHRRLNFSNHNKSIIGVGKGAEITGAGISIVNATNVILRNFAIRKIVNNDGITIQNSTRVWIDHNGTVICPQYADQALTNCRIQL